ncbi:hypothetical protein N9H39_00590 [Gammaproteobacteria bacterium]|nr:hypothetical protein [Gammaproteobacteria bacterium]
MFVLKMDQMGDDNKQLGRQVAGLFGDTLFALVVSVVGLFIFGTVVALIWDLVNKIL